MSDDAQGQGNGSGNGGNGGNGEQKPAVFSQADVDKILGERLAKAKRASEAELAQLREQVAQLTQAHEEATGKVTEADKIARKLTETEKRAAKAEQERDAARAEHAKTRVGYAAGKFVSSLDLANPAMAKTLLRDLEARMRLGEGGAVELVGDNGEGTALDDKSFAAFAASEYGWALKATTGSGSPHGAGKGAPKSNSNTGPLSMKPGEADRLFDEGFSERTTR